MDEAALSDALRRATDDVAVPRDLVRHAEHLGRERRARRRSGAAALAVGAAVLAGGALVVQGVGGSGSAGSTSGSASSASSAAGEADAAPAPTQAQDSRGSSVPAPTPTSQSGPEQPSAEAAAPGPLTDSAGCLPALTVDGASSGRTAPVRAGASVEVVGAASCGPLPAGTRFVITLDVAGDATAPAVLADVEPDADGSFDARVTVPASTPAGPAVLAVRDGGQRSCPSAAECPGAVDLRVLADPPPDRPAPTPEESS